jgi:OmpA-OmpF porin, OOP family
MRFWRVAALAVGLSLIGVAGQAQVMSPGADGPYVRFEGGWNHMMNPTIHSSSSSLAASASMDEGFIFGGALGYGFGRFRLEGDFDYRENRVSGVNVGNPGGIAGLASGGGGGTINSFAETINGYMDLPYNWLGFTPYIGAGAGAAHLKYSSVSSGGTQIIGDSDTIPVIQGMLGVHRTFSNNWGVGLEYRFLNGFHPNLRDQAGNRLSTNDYRNHSILLSISYSFGAPPPPPAPAATPAAAPAPIPAAAPPPAPVAGARQLFLVFFDFDKSTITAAGRQVLDAAANAFKRDRVVRIELTGYTDTVGTQQYNLNLSRKRAMAVRDYMARQGVPQNRMDVAWKGKEDLRVPTPDGVREPQNRRVEIVVP